MINATYTLRNTVKGTHATFRIKTWERAGERVVERCVGHDTFLAIGFLKADGAFISWKKFRGSQHEAACVYFVRALLQVAAGREVPGIEWRIAEKCCARCNKALTTPASLDTGFGPTCAARIGIPHEAKSSLNPQEFIRALADTMAQLKGKKGPDDDGPRGGHKATDNTSDDLMGALDYFAKKEAASTAAKASARDRAIEAKRQDRRNVASWGGGKAVAAAVYAPIIKPEERDPLETMARMAERLQHNLDCIFGFEQEFSAEEEARHVALCGVWNG